jgi:exonuclease SbcD
MRILHTADWHLGKKLDMHDRFMEHQLFLDWLLKTIDNQGVEAMIIAGDVFDTGSPSNESLRMYYNFLVDLHKTCCRQVVIIGGNHDSISTLNAPADLLKVFNVHVVGGVPANRAEQVIMLHTKLGKPAAVVAAVPFLRDKDVRLSIPGETAEQRSARITEGIAAHYNQLLPLLPPGIPAIATGHLFTQGAVASDSEKEIHVGTLGQFPAQAFPQYYSYIALGHLHRPQAITGYPHIRYSGSPLPLSFSESADKKEVVLLSIQPDGTLQSEALSIPCFRPLWRISGPPETIMEQFSKLPQAVAADQLPAWLEVQVHTPVLLTEIQEALNRMVQQHPAIEQFFLRQIKLKQTGGLASPGEEALELADMSVEHVFEKRLESLQLGEDAALLRQTFAEALQLMEETP